MVDDCTSTTRNDRTQGKWSRGWLKYVCWPVDVAQHEEWNVEGNVGILKTSRSFTLFVCGQRDDIDAESKYYSWNTQKPRVVNTPLWRTVFQHTVFQHFLFHQFPPSVSSENYLHGKCFTFHQYYHLLLMQSSCCVNLKLAKSVSEFFNHFFNLESMYRGSTSRNQTWVTH